MSLSFRMGALRPSRVFVLLGFLGSAVSAVADVGPQAPESAALNPFTAYFHSKQVETEEISLEQLAQLEAANKKKAKISQATPQKPTDPASLLSGSQVISAADAKCLEAQAVGKTMSEELSMADLNEIIAIGKEVWELVKTGKPVVDVRRDEIAILPLKVECWRHLEGWRNPVVKAYRTRLKNLMGITVVDFTYKVISYSGGSYRGVGQYLARVSVVPVNTYVAPWWEFNANVRVPGIFNYGTVDNPVASVEVEISYSVRTVLTHLDQVDNFLVKGSGDLLKL